MPELISVTELVNLLVGALVAGSIVGLLAAFIQVRR